MKLKVLKNVFVLTLATFSAVSISACGINDKVYLGVYKCDSTRMINVTSSSNVNLENVYTQTKIDGRNELSKSGCALSVNSNKKTAYITWNKDIVLTADIVDARTIKFSGKTYTK